MTREYPERPIVGVGAVVIVRPTDAELLRMQGNVPEVGVVLVKRLFEPLAGQWSLPGGVIETGETLEAGVAREILEETGLVVDVGPVIEVFDRIMLDADERVQYHFVLIDYLCTASGGRLEAGSDVSEVVVADPDTLEPYALTDKARAVIVRGLEALSSS